MNFEIHLHIIKFFDKFLISDNYQKVDILTVIFLRKNAVFATLF